MNNKPVAWTDHIGGFVDYGDDPNYPHPLYSHETTMDLLYEIAKLKAHPVKELTDEEIHKIWMGDEFTEEWTDGSISTIHYNKFARAILRKAQEK